MGGGQWSAKSAARETFWQRPGGAKWQSTENVREILGKIPEKLERVGFTRTDEAAAIEAFSARPGARAISGICHECLMVNLRGDV